MLYEVITRCDDDTIGLIAMPATVVSQNRMRDDRGRGVLEIFGDVGRDPVGGQHLQSGGMGRFRQSMSIHAEEQGAAYPCLGTVITDRLGDGKDVAFVEGSFGR